MEKLIRAIMSRPAFSLMSEGNSMLPLLYPGDLVYYRKTHFSRCKVNDLILVKKKDTFFTHRIIYKTEKYLITRGDNNQKIDGKIYPHHVLAKVIKVKRKGKFIDPEIVYLLQSAHYLKEINFLKKKLHKNKIPFVILKGLPLHLQYEGSHPRRLYADCDLLICKEHFSKVKKILEKQRYIKNDSSFSRINSFFQDREIELCYYKEKNGFNIVFDIHFEVSFLIVHLGKLNALYHERMIQQLTEYFFSSSVSMDYGGEPYPILSPRALILYLAIHLYHHNFVGVFRFQFIDCVIRKSHLEKKDWNNLVSMIQKYRLEAYLYPVFYLLIELWGTPIPGYFMKAIKPEKEYIHYLSQILNKPLQVVALEPRFKAGVRRFKNLFFLTRKPFWKKVWIFFYPQVFFAIGWVLFRKVSSFFSFPRQGRKNPFARVSP